MRGRASNPGRPGSIPGTSAMYAPVAQWIERPVCCGPDVSSSLTGGTAWGRLLSGKNLGLDPRECGFNTRRLHFLHITRCPSLLGRARFLVMPSTL